MNEENYTVDEQDEQKDVQPESDLDLEIDLDDESGEESNQLQQDDVARLKAENAKLQRLLKKKSNKVEAPERKAETGTPEFVTKTDLEKFRLEAKGYDEEQIEFIMSVGGASALKNPHIVKTLNSMKEEKEQFNAQAQTKSQGKATRVYTADEVKAMPLEKLEKLIREGKIKNL